MLPFQNRSLVDIKDEEWIDVLGYDGIYEISNFGRVKSLGRFVNASNGGQVWIKEKILKQHIGGKLHDTSVKLSVNNKAKTHRIMTLVADGFLRDRKEGEEICRIDKIKTNNHINNLIITSHSHSQEITYKRGNLKNWGIETIPKRERANYEKSNFYYENDVLTKIKCVKCGEILSIKEFYINNKRNIRACRLCISKTTQESKNIKNAGKLIERKKLAENGLRYCSICKQLKNLNEDFGNNRNAYLGKSNNCKECIKKENAKYRKIQKDKKIIKS